MGKDTRDSNKLIIEVIIIDESEWEIYIKKKIYVYYVMRCLCYKMSTIPLINKFD